MSSIIEIHGVGKKFKLEQSQRYLALRDVISNAGKKLFNKKQVITEFWALKDINLEIQQGERVGIIGRNGAGKSTLLKILSRITPPTTGNIKLHGRVASLLEVGTGFHPELTGRENIFLNGAILGLRKKEIQQRLDEIIDFSGVEHFMDMPLKHFSSGMQLRLAFSVAAHLEPEILLIDEVLAVGDMEFQKKCIGKMEEVSKTDGRTILFVSHNLGLLKSFCEKCLYLQNGVIKGYGKTQDIIDTYLKEMETGIQNVVTTGNGAIDIHNYEIGQGENKTADLFLGHQATIEIQFTPKENLQMAEIAFNFKNLYGELISHITTIDQSILVKLIAGKTYTVKAVLQSVNFTPGTYLMDLFILNNGQIFKGLFDCIRFNVLNSEKVMRPGGFPSHVKVYSETSWEINQ